MTNLLMQDDDEKFDKDKNQYLFFTTQEVMDKILEELKILKIFEPLFAKRFHFLKN